MTDLSAYGALADRVARLGEEDDLTITASDFPDGLPEVQRFGRLILDTDYRRFIGSAGPGADRPFEILDRSQGFNAYIEAGPLRHLGLWLLHILFSGREWAGLDLTHPTSRVRWLYVQISSPEPYRSFLKTEGSQRYVSYAHWPRAVSRHAFADLAMAGTDRVAPEDRPLFALGWSKPDESWTLPIRDADQIIWDLTPEGLCALASLFFDMGHASFGLNEVNMEPPYLGFAATQPRSIEARFWLPGSMGFYCDRLDDLTLPPRR
ncbi:hypothetical protein V8J82_06350 [Gymnodinialimonas sp. 2305UL16-5]|uniref:hypothetical protein n=1 Tax=Gymnodinialimonas mytili TaxID=3126503 RepID=UPI0030A587F1